MNKGDLVRIFMQIESELNESFEKYGDFAGFHEAYAVIQEEVDELWDEIKFRHRNKEKIKREARQVAAMAVKLLLCLKTMDR